MTLKIFKTVANFLLFVAQKTGLTYKEINIIVYFLLIPFSWLCLLDIIFNIHFLKITFAIFTIGFFVGCPSFKNYSDGLFAKSVSFLNYFNKFGSNYVVSSVWICVVMPIVVYGLLLFLVLK